MSYELVTLPAYRAVGLKWEGTYSEIKPHLKNIINQMVNRSVELKHKVNPTIQLGLSYHVVKNGFAHYSVFEVDEKQKLPEGMIEIRVPEWTYVKATHHKGQDIQQTYTDLHIWLYNSDYTPLREQGIAYYDDMPIKHEHYPIDRDMNDEHFDIYIPVVKKLS